MAKDQTTMKSGDAVYILTYFFTVLSGIIVYLVSSSNSRRRFHALQAILLWIVAVVLGFIPVLGWLIALLIWLYGLYIGIEAYNGKDMMVPVLGDWAKGSAGYKA